jgi:Domain of unknown function (DUF4397)
MKKLNIIVFFAAVTMASCSKSGDTPNIKLTPLSSFNVTNAVVGGATLYLNTSVEDSVVTNTYSPLTILAGQSVIDLHPIVSPNTAYFNQAISTANGSYYSLFLSGTSPSSVDHVLIRESYKNYTDSVCAVRFINLSPDSQPISIDIQGNANGSEVRAWLTKPIQALNNTRPKYRYQAITSNSGMLRPGTCSPPIR